MAKGKYQKWLEPEGLILLGGWARDGLTDEKIAKNMDISRSTLNEWKNKYPDISDTLKRGKEIADYQVEDALFKSAIGYSYEEITEELRFDKKSGEYKLMITKRITKHVPPNVTAMIFWLKNRRPDAWADRRDVSVDLSSSQKFDDILAQMGGEGLEE